MTERDATHTVVTHAQHVVSTDSVRPTIGPEAFVERYGEPGRRAIERLLARMVTDVENDRQFLDSQKH
jgi:hypothetical protein